jgi:hypothetical protein
MTNADLMARIDGLDEAVAEWHARTKLNLNDDKATIGFRKDLQLFKNRLRRIALDAERDALKAEAKALTGRQRAVTA